MPKRLYPWERLTEAGKSFTVYFPKDASPEECRRIERRVRGAVSNRMLHHPEVTYAARLNKKRSGIVVKRENPEKPTIRVGR